MGTKLLQLVSHDINKQPPLHRIFVVEQRAIHLEINNKGLFHIFDNKMREKLSFRNTAHVWIQHNEISQHNWTEKNELCYKNITVTWNWDLKRGKQPSIETITSKHCTKRNYPP